jgi:anti-sigma regulatory factor (Ser/Thr protein kinase)
MRAGADGAAVVREWNLAAGDHAGASRARREFARAILDINGSSAGHAAAELVFGELVHNAVRHAAHYVKAELVVAGDVRLRIEDDGPCFLLPHPPAEPNAESGRGLAIVATMTEGLSVKHADSGCCIVTARLPLRVPAALRGC